MIRNRKKNLNPRVKGKCRKQDLPSFRCYPLTRELGFLGLQLRQMFDYFSYL